MTTLNGYIQGYGGGENRTVSKTGKEIKLSVYDNIDRVIVFNEAGETSQKTLTGKNLFDISRISSGSVAGVDYDVNVNTGIITVNGEATGSGWKVILSFNLPETGTYHFHLERTGNVGYFLERYSSLGGDATVVCNDITTTYRLAIDTFTTGESYEGTIYNIQIEKGSTATSYEPYCGGIPSPNPSYPQDIKGIGFLYHGAYAVAIDYDDGDEHYGRILATGLAYPLYEGDVLDFANGKVIRANGYKVLNGSDINTATKETNLWRIYFYNQVYNVSGAYPNAYANKYKVVNSYASVNQTNNALGINKTEGQKQLLIRDDTLTSVQDIKDSFDDLNLIIVYPLATPVDEYITLTGDISDIETATVTADGTLTVKYDKAEMAIRKYSAKPDWQKIGYSDTPQIILDGFNYSKQIYDSWTSAASYASQYRGDKALKFFPEVDLTGATNYSAMFQESGILSTPPLTIGDGSNTVINSQWMFQTSPIEKIELTTSEATQKVQIANIFNGCTMLKNAKLTLSASGSMQYAFADCNRLERIEDGLETSDVTSFSEAFRACSSLLYLYELDLNSCTTCYRAFYNCTSLYSAPYLKNIGNGVNFQQMFWNCSSLRTIPPYNLHSPNNLTNMFQGTGSNLEEASRNNILMMLAACTYSGTKTLAHLGFTASMYSAASWQALPGYNDFVSAGWSIGYN